MRHAHRLNDLRLEFFTSIFNVIRYHAIFIYKCSKVQLCYCTLFICQFFILFWAFTFSVEYRVWRKVESEESGVWKVISLSLFPLPSTTPCNKGSIVAFLEKYFRYFRAVERVLAHSLWKKWANLSKVFHRDSVNFVNENENRNENTCKND